MWFLSFAFIKKAFEGYHAQATSVPSRPLGDLRPETLSRKQQPRRKDSASI
jgi:hypothetical protein